MDEADKQFIREAIYEALEPFVAHLAQDHEETRAWMRQVDRRLDALEQRVGALDRRVGALEQRVEALAHQVASLERRVTRLETEVQELRKRLDSLEQRLAEKGFVESESIARERWATFSDLRRVELRVTQLEAAVFHGPQPAQEATG